MELLRKTCGSSLIHIVMRPGTEINWPRHEPLLLQIKGGGESSTTWKLKMKKVSSDLGNRQIHVGRERTHVCATSGGRRVMLPSKLLSDFAGLKGSLIDKSMEIKTLITDWAIWPRSAWRSRGVREVGRGRDSGFKARQLLPVFGVTIAWVMQPFHKDSGQQDLWQLIALDLAPSLRERNGEGNARYTEYTSCVICQKKCTNVAAISFQGTLTWSGIGEGSPKLENNYTSINKRLLLGVHIPMC